jgi:hypothetical protein
MESHEAQDSILLEKLFLELSGGDLAFFYRVFDKSSLFLF